MDMESVTLKSDMTYKKTSENDVSKLSVKATPKLTPIQKMMTKRIDLYKQR